MTEHGAGLVTVASVDEAVDFLLQNWPSPKSSKFNAARQACLAALEGKKTAGAARSAFIRAARESGLYVRKRSPSASDTGDQ
ncbi:MAG: DUF982 domain-containing protein [Phyllobacterium sp.]|uniref:DUF982 domain-containing protein n=1 Tax=Phyllobacterium sp. TaxID=1871046 RepID=UPI0030EFDFD9